MKGQGKRQERPEKMRYQRKEVETRSFVATSPICGVVLFFKHKPLKFWLLFSALREAAKALPKTKQTPTLRSWQRRVSLVAHPVVIPPPLVFRSAKSEPLS